MDAVQLAGMIDHTLLRPEATSADVAAAIQEAEDLRTFGVCISPSRLARAKRNDPSVRLVTVCGFPSGAHTAQAKAYEAVQAVRDGAQEVDMGLFGHWVGVMG